MKHIAIDIRSLLDKTPTGVAMYTRELLERLAERTAAAQYYLFCNSAKGDKLILPERVQADPRFQVIYTRWPNKLLHLAVVLRLIRLDRFVEKRIQQKLDLWWSPGFAFTHLSRTMRQVLTVHDLSFEIVPDTFSWWRQCWHRLVQTKRQCQRADQLVVPSENTKRDLLNLYTIATQKIQVIPLQASPAQAVSVDAQRDVRKRYGLPERFVLFVGTIEPRKQVNAVLDAFVQYRQHNHRAYNLSFVIAGKAGWRNRRLMKKIKNTEHVLYLQYVSESDKVALYQMAELFIWPSLYEGFGLPVLEAMQAGTPVITSARSSLPEVGGAAAYYIDPMNIASIGEGMQRILQEKEVQQRLSNAGKKQASLHLAAQAGLIYNDLLTY